MFCIMNWNANGIDYIKGKMLVVALSDQVAELVNVMVLTETGGMHNAQMQYTGFYVAKHLQGKHAVG